MEDLQLSFIDLRFTDSAPWLFPFLIMHVSSRRYKVFGLVINMDCKGGELISWKRERCGKSEEAQSLMKEDLAVAAGHLRMISARTRPGGELWDLERVDEK